MGTGTGEPVWHADSPTAHLAVIAALELEAALLRDVPGSHGPRLYVSGPGAARAARAASEAIRLGARALVSWGLAGGLHESARTGCVILPERVLSEAGAWTCDAVWSERLLRQLQPGIELLRGTLFTADAVLVTPAAKAELAARTGAVAVDMESAAIAAAAAAAGIPFLALRVIADGPDDALPERIDRLVTPAGRTRLAGLPQMLVSPVRLRQLLRLGRQSRRARAVLRQLAPLLVGGLA